MIILKKYRGHIRNREALCRELDINIESAQKVPQTAAQKAPQIAPQIISLQAPQTAPQIMSQQALQAAPQTEPPQTLQKTSQKALEELIIIRAYEKWGSNMAEHIYGMFALALWDDEKNELFCLRDQFGTKPFYYYVTQDGSLLYGTYIREILNQEGFKKEFNEDMLQLYLSLSYVAGEDTFFKGIKKLMPGHFLVWTRKSGIKISRYWKPEFKPDNTKSIEDFSDEINKTMKLIMSEMLSSGETAESFLSGGVDSSYVFAVSTAKNANAIGYEEEKLDESRLAAKTAELLNKSISRRIVKPEEYFEIVPWVMENMELPLGDASAIVFALGCRAAAEHCDICYSGEGSDEFFGGYNVYRNADIYGRKLQDFYVGNTNIMKEDEKKNLLKSYNPGILPINLVKNIYTEIKDYEPLSKMCDIDIQIWLEGDIYLNVDKMSTACGLEVRMPITDMRMFDIASRMPAEYKIPSRQKATAAKEAAARRLQSFAEKVKPKGCPAEKAVPDTLDLNKLAFRKAASAYLPEEIAYRKKLGFVVPIRYWLADDSFNKPVKEKLFGTSADKFFNMSELKKIWKDYKNGNSDLWRKIWVIYTFLVWYDIYFAEASR